MSLTIPTAASLGGFSAEIATDHAADGDYDPRRTFRLLRGACLGTDDFLCEGCWFEYTRTPLAT
jgi:hypothetical protein